MFCCSRRAAESTPLRGALNMLQVEKEWLVIHATLSSSSLPIDESSGVTSSTSRGLVGGEDPRVRAGPASHGRALGVWTAHIEAECCSIAQQIGFIGPPFQHVFANGHDELSHGCRKSQTHLAGSQKIGRQMFVSRCNQLWMGIFSDEVTGF